MPRKASFCFSHLGLDTAPPAGVRVSINVHLGPGGYAQTVRLGQETDSLLPCHTQESQSNRPTRRH